MDGAEPAGKTNCNEKYFLCDLGVPCSEKRLSANSSIKEDDYA
jgi:hypothetical protein